LGGECRTTALDQEELSICNDVSIFLKKNDIFLAGIDLLSHKLIEINITSPTGLVILNKLYNKKYEELIVEAIEKRINHGIIRGLR
jgi:glutathione synthase